MYLYHMGMPPSLHAQRVVNRFFTTRNFPGKWRVERFLLPHVKFIPDFYLHPFGFWWKIVDESTKRTFLTNCENSTSRLFIKIAEKKRILFIDIGSNLGWYSLLAASLQPGSTVFAFEPVELVRSKLEDNLRRNGNENVRVMPFALGHNPHTAQIWSYAGNDGMHTLYPIEEWSAESGSQIEVKTLDSYAQTFQSYGLPILMKIDVEGSEMDVLRGGTQLLNLPQVQLIVEVNETMLKAGKTSANQLFEFLRSLGFSGYWISPNFTLVASKEESLLPHRGKLPELEGGNYFFTRDSDALEKIFKIK